MYSKLFAFAENILMAPARQPYVERVFSVDGSPLAAETQLINRCNFANASLFKN